MNWILTFLKENPKMLIGTAAVVVLLGGSMVIELPADREIKKLKMELAQNWQQRQTWEQQQQQYHTKREIDDIDWRLRQISQEINRINQIPQYLNRPITHEEAWQIETLKKDFMLLQERRYKLTGK